MTARSGVVVRAAATRQPAEAREGFQARRAGVRDPRFEPTDRARTDSRKNGSLARRLRELCAELDIPFALKRITPDELRDADEVFISSTAGGVMPVARIDERILGNGRPGPLTMRIRELYWRKHEQGWHATPVDFDSP